MAVVTQCLQDGKCSQSHTVFAMFYILKVVMIKVQIFRDITLCRLVSSYQSFGAHWPETSVNV